VFIPNVTKHQAIKAIHYLNLTLSIIVDFQIAFMWFLLCFISKQYKFMAYPPYLYS